MAIHTVFLGVIVVAVCWLHFARASYLSLTAEPSVIHPVITAKLQLRCSVKNGTVLTHILLQNNSSSTQEADMTQTPSTTDRFLAIAIMKVNEKSGSTEAVASVTGCEVPVIQQGFANTIKAEGSSEGSQEPDELGYLLLTWDHPSTTDSGTFKCEAIFLNPQSFSQTLRTSLDVPANEPSLSDLITYISANSKYIASLEKQVQELAKENQELSADVKQLSNRTLEQRVLTTDNIQTGSASCKNQYIYFPHAFRNEPVIFTSVSSLSFQRLDYYSQSFSIQVDDVSSYGFSVNCTTPSYYTTAGFDWLGIGN
ncbi:unnamed protein product [Lymnaea stagnalis]|uniref:H-type lectin domain-containing protein n=1 Tax=Lymnaea stagnalis TaxID=6523 RepID=A0AAV2IKQ0_LYMST